jgi:Domain of unknown function (DUF4105)
MRPSTARLILLLISLLLSGCGYLKQRPAELTSGKVAQRFSTLLASARLVEIAQPSHDLVWRSNLSVLPYAEIHADRVHVHNIRDTYYRSEDDYDVRHFDAVILLDDIRSIDFIVVPFKNAPSLAHTMISFGLKDGQQIGFSVEARLEKDERFDPFEGAINHYELIAVVATERDLIGLRTSIRGDDTYLYRTTAQPPLAQEIFVAAMTRINQIAKTPEFYDTLNNNCTTNILNLVNKLKPGFIQQDVRVLLPGHSDKLLYDQGFIQAWGPFEQVKQASRINLQSNLNYGSAEFSRAIRNLSAKE